MTEHEHREEAFASLNHALAHAGRGLTALRKWKGDHTFEHPTGLAGSEFFLGAKRLGEAVAHRNCLALGDAWDQVHCLVNQAESALFDLSVELATARERDD